MGMLYAYPLSRKKLIFAKLTLISGLILLFHLISNVFQHLAIFLIGLQFRFVSYRPENMVIQLVIIISTILLGFIPLAAGMVNKSSLSTVVASVVIVAFSSNSQGSSAGVRRNTVGEASSEWRRRPIYGCKSSKINRLAPVQDK